MGRDTQNRQIKKGIRLIGKVSNYPLEAGIDEAGRGCLAGPVVASAVILPDRFDIPGLNDSKKLSRKQRLIVRDAIIEQAVAWATGSASPEEIDRFNILQATFLAMHRAIAALEMQPRFLAIDGNHFRPYKDIPYHCFIGGDHRVASIAAASILAKTTRDQIMENLNKEFPGYAWDTNKGYPTVQHRQGIRKLGPSPWHRMSFKLLEEQMTLPWPQNSV